MQLILLSGGSGTRLWPLSNESRSKQFLKLLKMENGEYESMLQRVYRQIREILPEEELLITTCGSQRDAIISQIGAGVSLINEPQRRDTFPAIMLSAAYLEFERQTPGDEAVVILPVDPYVQPDYFRTIRRMGELVEKGEYNLTLMGISPTYASEKYGYILPDGEPEDKEYQTVRSFREKPSARDAAELIKQGALWNGGVFACKLSYLTDILRQKLDVSGFQEVYDRYGELKKTSFDYAVVEKEPSIAMLRYDGPWKDLGTWNTITDEMRESVIGKAILGEDAANTYIINELAVPVVALGTRNLIIAASPDGILVSDLDRSSYMKPYVQNLGQRPMYEERRWGEYRVIDFVRYENGLYSLTKHMTVNPGCSFSYQRHTYRDEIWTIVDGTADVLLDGYIRNVRPGDVVYITKGQMHALRATSLLHFIEVQRGETLLEEDIERFPWKW